MQRCRCGVQRCAVRSEPCARLYLRLRLLYTCDCAYSTHSAHRVVAHVGERNELACAPAVHLVEINVVAHLALC